MVRSQGFTWWRDETAFSSLSTFSFSGMHMREENQMEEIEVFILALKERRTWETTKRDELRVRYCGESGEGI